MVENLEFRKILHRELAQDKGKQKAFLQMCRDEPRIFFDTVAWTLDPRKSEGQRNLPFILREKQGEAVLKVNNCILIGKDAAINKSKDEGASELLTKITTNKFLLSPETLIRIGSRVETLVDKTGDKTTLFAKIDYTINHLPIWWKMLLGWDGKNKVEDEGFSLLERNLLHLRHRGTESTIDGEATSSHFGAGRRSAFMVLDEIGRVDANIAEQIISNTHDITDCALFNSTHFFGTGHPFAKLLKKEDMEVIRLLWYDNPDKNYGLYQSDKVGFITIKDKSYYINKFPAIESMFDLNKPIEYSLLKQFLVDNKSKIDFVADGGEKQPIVVRSIWHDREERSREWEDLCKNVWAYPAGAADTFFDSAVNDKIRLHSVKPPKFQGEITYDFAINENTGLKTKKVIKPELRRNFGKNPLKWWGDLFNDKDGKLRPNQSHNYVIGCDVSFGLGSSNSTAMILDVNTGELIGEYVSAGLYPQDFGLVVSALALWVGGVTKVPYIIWERNGGHGQIFGETILGQGFNLVYTDTVEDAKTRVRKNRYGWTSTGGVNGSKNLVLGNLKNALREGLKEEKTNGFIIIYSEELVDELDSYMWFPSGDVDSGESLDLSTGARARHGDRIIGTALARLGAKEQPKAKKTNPDEIGWNSWQARRDRQLANEAARKEFWKDTPQKRFY